MDWFIFTQKFTLLWPTMCQCHSSMSRSASTTYRLSLTRVIYWMHRLYWHAPFAGPDWHAPRLSMLNALQKLIPSRIRNALCYVALVCINWEWLPELKKWNARVTKSLATIVNKREEINSPWKTCIIRFAVIMMVCVSVLRSKFIIAPAVGVLIPKQYPYFTWFKFVVR